MPRACIKDMTERLPDFICPTDYYALLLFHVRTSDTAVSNMKNIKDDKELEAALNEELRSTVSLLISPPD